MNDRQTLAKAPPGLKLPPAGRGILLYWTLLVVWWTLMLLTLGVFQHTTISELNGLRMISHSPNPLPAGLVTVVYVGLLAAWLRGLRKSFTGTTIRPTSRSLLYVVVASHGGRCLTFRSPMSRVAFGAVCAAIGIGIPVLAIIQSGVRPVLLVCAFCMGSAGFCIAAWRNELHLDLETRSFHRRHGFAPFAREWRGPLAEISLLSIVWENAGFGTKCRRAWLVWTRSDIPQWPYREPSTSLPLAEDTRKLAQALGIALKDETEAPP